MRLDQPTNNCTVALCLTCEDLVRYNLTKGLVYDRRAVEGDPLIYILTMLLFFSAGIASLMIIYMKKEQRDIEEANFYKFYVEAARDRYAQYMNRGRSLNKLALQALNAVNLISQYQDDTGSKVTFV
ncbi:uncharacterized protein LOC111694990 [Eurytemora carolleeae]|uniref:uncharacterized protein LOC111694990 n=1 Tax=Eurytemora carolleeae TaxID=1294199 RepID=UPI000C7940E7|nr:uncharacterized protein LOC111694990 [Eurytemora carolleeae]|eukprot:XP_023319871.1 uncharacterized protein LOC111694990 [Eurytemora affinis]